VSGRHHRKGKPASPSSRDKLPASPRGEKSTYTCAEKAKYWREYGLSLVAGADDGIGGTIIIDGGASSEARTRPDSCANEGVPPAMPARREKNFLHTSTGKSLVCSFGPDDDCIVSGGLELAIEGFLAVGHDADVHSGAELFKVVPCRILGATERRN